MGRHSCCYKQKLRKGLWSPEEDEKLMNHITKHGHGCWSTVPKLAERTSESSDVDPSSGGALGSLNHLLSETAQSPELLPVLGKHRKETTSLAHLRVPPKELFLDQLVPGHDNLPSGRLTGPIPNFPFQQLSCYSNGFGSSHGGSTNSLWYSQNEASGSTISTVMPPVSPSTLSTSTGLNRSPDNQHSGGTAIQSTQFYWDTTDPTSSSSRGSSGSNGLGFELQGTSSLLESSVFPWTDLADKNSQAHLEEELKWPDLLHGTFTDTPATVQNLSQSLYEDVVKAESQFNMEGLCAVWSQNLQPPQHLQAVSDLYDKDLQRMSLSFENI
ncbi:hypothetical protein EJB05_32446 [Eragrostis curvula]|uniref:Uncharacterized protein n=1 Tax=Eragrostis curvula TaxID=38414 RepID=A0A5J9UG65_9POAL|nr:hypothetical protein EJB05_32446 [Eragrostis curvula]